MRLASLVYRVGREPLLVFHLQLLLRDRAQSALHCIGGYLSNVFPSNVVTPDMS